MTSMMVSTGGALFVFGMAVGVGLSFILFNRE